MTFFDKIHCLLIANVLGKSKVEFFVRKLKDFGGDGVLFTTKLKLTDLSSYTHVIVDASLTSQQLEKILGSLCLEICSNCVT